MLEKLEKIEKCLMDNYIGYSGVWKESNRNLIAVQIDWGDWKHDHGRCDYLLHKNLGLFKTKEKVTEEDGSDCYSSIHYYSAV